jgi:aromatic-L-amino-acid decarboxylase
MATRFDLDYATRGQLGHKLIDRLNDYFSSLESRAVQLPAEERKLTYVSQPVPETGEDPEVVFEQIFRELCDRGFHITSANYLGLMNPTPTFVSVLAEMVVASINPQLASVERSASASLIEKQTIDWIGQLLGWKPPFGGVFTTGGSEANSSAMNLALARLCPDAIQQGLRSMSGSAVLYASQESHHSLDKAAGMLGFGRHALRRIAVTKGLQMDLVQLEKTIRSDIHEGNIPFCVVGTAGTTNTGAIDDLSGLAEIANRFGLWFHVDGAYGAAVIFSRRHRELVRGIELADSVSIDPHKWLAVPFAAGILLTHQPNLMRKTFSVSAPYLRDSPQEAMEDQYQTSSQWSRRMNSLKLWATLRVHGRQSYEVMIDNQISLAAAMAHWLRESGLFELCAPQMLSAVAFRVKLSASEEEVEAANRAVVEDVNHSGERWISLTTVAGRSAIRTMVISYLTTERHLQGLQQALQQAATRVIEARGQSSLVSP